jgi:hypothetical protein
LQRSAACQEQDYGQSIHQCNVLFEFGSWSFAVRHSFFAIANRGRICLFLVLGERQVKDLKPLRTQGEQPLASIQKERPRCESA